eukprot:82000_1
MADQQTTQSKYKKKKKPEQQPSIDPNEVRIKGNQGHVKRYVDYACALLDGKRVDKQAEENKEAQDGDEAPKPVEPKKFDTIVLKATGRAINKAVTTAEVVKRRVGGLHQITSLETLEITDVWEPLEEGLKEVETKRRVASITIKLSRDETDIDMNAIGYQQPISADAIKPFTTQTRNRRGGGPRRGGGYRRGGGNRGARGGGRRGGGGYRNRRGGGYQDRRGGGRRGGYGGGGYGSPNRSPRGGGGRYGGPPRGRGRGRGGYNRNRGGGYGGGYNQRNRY